MKIIPHIQDGGIVLDTKMGEAAEVRFVWAGGWDEEVTLTIDEARALRDQLTALLPAARTPADVLTDPQPGASPIMDAVRAQPGLEHVKGTDTDLLITLLRSRQGWEPVTPRWSHVRLMAGHGSTVGHALCVAAGIDPNEEAPDVDEETCSRCGSYLRDGKDEEDEGTADVPLTPRENTLRGVGPSALSAAKTHCAHGHPLSGDNLLVTWSHGRPARVCRECRRARRVSR